MEIAGLRIARNQLRNAAVVVYSLVVVATILPDFPLASKLVVLPYFLIVPGYFVTLILEHTGTILERLFYTLAWSIAIFVSVYSLETVFPGNPLPIDLVVPVLTILLLLYVQYHTSK